MNGSLGHADALLHIGSVLHVRHALVHHEFRYRLWMISVDLDRIDEVAHRSKYFRHNRFALVSIHDRDHGPRDGSALRPWVNAQLEKAGLGDATACIHFMAIPRMVGYGFSPIAFYFCHDVEGRLRAVLHQVKNTFGDQTPYLLTVEDPAAPLITQYADKTMIVSPFFDRDGGYSFAFNRPDFRAPDPTSPKPPRFDISIRYGAEVPRLSAVMSLHTRAMTDVALRRLLAAMPFMTLKVITMIHWQALRLWLKRVPFLGTQRQLATASPPSPHGS